MSIEGGFTSTLSEGRVGGLFVGMFGSPDSSFHSRRTTATTPLFDRIVDIANTMRNCGDTYFDSIERVLLIIMTYIESEENAGAEFATALFYFIHFIYIKTLKAFSGRVRS